MRHADTWICIADAARARFYRCDGPGRGIEPMLDCALGAHSRTSFKGETPGLAETIAGRLDRAAEGHLFEHLVLVAPMPVLGAVKGSLKPATRARVVGEVDRQLTHATPREVETHIRDTLPH